MDLALARLGELSRKENETKALAAVEDMAAVALRRVDDIEKRFREHAATTAALHERISPIQSDLVEIKSAIDEVLVSHTRRCCVKGPSGIQVLRAANSASHREEGEATAVSRADLVLKTAGEVICRQQRELAQVAAELELESSLLSISRGPEVLGIADRTTLEQEETASDVISEDEGSQTSDLPDSWAALANLTAVGTGDFNSGDV